MNKQKFITIFLSFICVMTISATGYTAWKMNKSKGNPVENLTEFPISDQEHFLDVTITTDKPQYKIGETVRIKINNQSEHETYVWGGLCSFTLESYNTGTWSVNPASWSGCPSCGIMREIPDPLFLGPLEKKEIGWDQIVTWCEKDRIEKGATLGRFRFVFRYAKDEPECRVSTNPFECWLRYSDKKWHSSYSSEFTIK